MASRSDDPRFIGKGATAVPNLSQPGQAGARPEKEDWTIGEPHEVEGGTNRGRRTPGEVAPRHGAGGYAAVFLGFTMLALAAAVTAAGYVALMSRRPWVGLTEGQQVATALTEQGMQVRFGFRNFGAMPARWLKVTASLISGPAAADHGARQAPAVLCSAGAGTAGTVLFPGAEGHGTAVLSGPVDSGVIEQIVSGERRLYLVGCMTYDDGLGWLGEAPRRTTFCRQFLPQSAGTLGVMGDFADCSGGNDAD